jgi:apolipoprotein N-acyltransferase
MSRLRAIEFGRSTVQISTVGVSALILPDGSVVNQTGLFSADQLYGSLPLRTSLTPAVYLGRPIELLALFAWLLPVAVGLAVKAARALRRDRSSIPDSGT